MKNGVEDRQGLKEEDVKWRLIVEQRQGDIVKLILPDALPSWRATLLSISFVSEGGRWRRDEIRDKVTLEPDE